MSSRAGEHEFDSRFTMLGGESMPQPTPGLFKIFTAVKLSSGGLKRGWRRVEASPRLDPCTC